MKCINILTISLIITFSFVSCTKIQNTLSTYLIQKRINHLLEGKSDSYKEKYVNMPMFVQDNNFKLVYHFKNPATEKIFKINPCVKIKSEGIKLNGEGVAVFQNAIVRAIELNASAYKLGEDENDLTIIDFYSCTNIESVKDTILISP